MNLHVVIYSRLDTSVGGRERWLEYFLPNIWKYFDVIHLYYLRSPIEPGEMDERFNVANICLHPITSSNFFEWIKATARNILSFINREDYLIAVGTGPEGVVGEYIKRRRKSIIFIVWLRTVLKNELLERKSKVFAFTAHIYEKKILKAADIIIANGYDTKEHYQKHTRKMIKVIPNAVENLEQLAKLDLPSFKKPIKVAHIGRFVKGRGCDFFLSVARILKGNTNFSFEVYGPVPNTQEIKNFINVIFHGPFDPKNIDKVLSKIDIAMFLLPSRKIHGGGVSHGLLEAMAAKRLIIAWGNDLVRKNKILDTNCGILCHEGNIGEVVEALNQISNNPSKFYDLCLQAYKCAEKFSVSEHINKFLEVIGRIK